MEKDKMTKTEIKKMATAIRKFLDDNYLNGDCRIYFNGMCWAHGSEDESITWDEKKHDLIDKPNRKGWKTIEDIDPRSYFDYANGFISMSFEGSLYDVLNGYSDRCFKLQDEFRNLLSGFGCFYELGNAWNLSVYRI